uniref:Lipoprotein n=1 Tax=Steinernema glaseri TaxID=37863 RepID=A0A1I7ZJL9_9BILA
MIVAPLVFFFFSVLAAVNGCANTPGAGPPTAEKSFRIDFSPPLDWTAKDTAARKKRATDDDPTTTTVGPKEDPATPTEKPKDPATGGDDKTTEAPKQEDPSALQQATVERAEKMMTTSIKNAIFDAIGRSGMAVLPTVSFDDLPDLKMKLAPADVVENTVVSKTLSLKIFDAIGRSGMAVLPTVTFDDLPDLKMKLAPADVVENTVLSKTLSLKVNVKIPYPAPDAAWQQISDATFVDLTSGYGVLVRKIQVVA